MDVATFVGSIVAALGGAGPSVRNPMRVPLGQAELGGVGERRLAAVRRRVAPDDLDARRLLRDEDDGVRLSHRAP